MEHIKHIILEVFNKLTKKDTCNCGCHDCDNVGNPGVVINESIKSPIVMSENMRYHVENKLPLTENTFRYGSKSFLDLWAEARYLYVREAIHVNDEDKSIITETNLGDFNVYEGKEVPLDMPMLEEDELEEATDEKKNPPLGKPKRGGSKKFFVYVRDKDKVKKVSFGGTTGLSVKINDPKARHAFAARHDCKNKKDRTKPSYWSCNIGRYWKQLGGAKNFSGYW